MTMEDALRFAQDGHPGALATGVLKICPRCGRVGWLFVNAKHPESVICIWAGAGRGGGEVDIDDFHVSDIFDPIVGCGYDPRETYDDA